MPPTVNVMVSKYLSLFLKLNNIFWFVSTAGEAFTPEGLVEVLNMALFVLFVWSAVSVLRDSQYGLTEGCLKLTY